MSALDEALNDVWEMVSELLASDARAELAQLRADLQAAQERIAEQARQLDAARELLTTLDWNDWSDKVDVWIAANPAPQEQPRRLCR